MNIEDLTDDAKSIALYSHLLLLKQRAVSKSQKQLAAMQKEAKRNGVVWADVKAALKEFGTDQKTREGRVQRTAAIYSAIGIPVQIDLFDSIVTRPNDPEAEARRKGWYAAITDEECAPPYDAGSAEGQAWINGWHEFQTLLTAYNNRFDQAEAEPFQLPNSDDDTIGIEEHIEKSAATEAAPAAAETPADAEAAAVFS